MSEKEMRYGIMCTRHSTSILGYAENWMRERGEIVLFDNLEEAERRASEVQGQTLSKNLTYRAERFAG